MKINFSSKKNTISNPHTNNIKIDNDIKKDAKQNDEFKKKSISQDQNMTNNPQNLADFFNGEIIEMND